MLEPRPLRQLRSPSLAKRGAFSIENLEILPPGANLDLGRWRSAPPERHRLLNEPIQGSALHSSGQAQENSMESAGLEEDLVDISSHGVLDPNLNEKLSEENLALFTRREDLRQRDTQLKQTIGELEHELEETKRKCSQLAAELQIWKSQQQLSYK
ncbi:hypothetical protein ACQ4PT_036252 [Festuca glaucescens]